MTHAAPPPGSREAIKLFFMEVSLEPGWSGIAADLVQSWLAYERDLTRYVVESKLKAERERAIEEAKQCCKILAEKSRRFSEAEEMALWCASSIDALKVIP